MTTLNVGLSSTLQGELDEPGVWAYAVYFDANGDNPVWTPIVTNGSIDNSGTVAIDLPERAGQKVYFLVQSQATSDPHDLPTLIKTESDIDWDNAGTYDFRYDSFEVTLQNAPFDAGNLTSVNGFGLPMEAEVQYSNGTTATVGYGISGSSLVTTIDSINPSNTYTADYTSGPLIHDFRMALSPTTAVGGDIANPPFKTSDWGGYVSSLEGPQALNVEVSGQFNGAADKQGLWHNGGYFAYRLQWDSTAGVFWLIPLANSEIKGDIKLTVGDLENSIYSTLGTAEIYASTLDAKPFLTMNTGLNNQWGKVLSAFLTGFTGGFYEASGKPLNPQVSGSIDLNTNINWDPSYAFGQNSLTAAPTYDPYSKIFYDDTNSYGSNYSDALMSRYDEGGPLLPVSDPVTGLNVPDINVTIFADGEKPSGYVPPKIYNYISADPGGYAVPVPTSTSCDVGLSLASAVAHNSGVVPAKTGTIELKILTSDSGDTPVWSTVTVDGSSPAAGAAGLWQNWEITYNSVTNSYSAAPQNDPPVTLLPGSILFTHFPTALNGVSWYQLVIGDKTFNVYTTTKDGLFENPAFSGQSDVLAVDGLATVTPGSSTLDTVSTFTVGLSDGDSVAIDPTLMQVNTATTIVDALPTADAPVAGVLSGGTFTALPGQTMRNTNTITTEVHTLAFGWTGSNNDPNTVSWIGAFTNKLDAGDIARITIAPTSGAPITTTGTADLDGRWETSTITLPNGTFTVSLQEFLPTDTSFSTPLTPKSNVLDIKEMPCFASGTRILTARGEVPVESLVVGDLIRSHAGSLVPVTWLGHRLVSCRRHARPHDILPVRVRRDAFGPAQPHRDLLLSPDHAVLVAGALIPVRYLVNGRTIAQEAADEITYHHVELARHDVLLAEGLACESYLDTGNRAAFGDGRMVALHPDFALRTWETEACAPLVLDGAKLAAARRSLLQRARRLGHTTTLDAALRMVADDRPLPVRRAGRSWHVRLPPDAQRVRLVSRTWTPAHMRATHGDTRTLGVAVSRLWLDGQEMGLASTGLVDGWHACEPDWRWTTGDATLLPSGARDLALEIAMTGTYWRDDAPRSALAA